MRHLLAASWIALVIGCGDNRDNRVGPDAGGAPAFRNLLSLPDAELALQSLQLLGAQVSGARADVQPLPWPDAQPA